MASQIVEWCGAIVAVAMTGVIVCGFGAILFIIAEALVTRFRHDC